MPTITDGPAVESASVTPNDGTTFPRATRSLYVGGDGDLRVMMVGGNEQIFRNVVAGQVYPFRVTRVFATGTTATNIVALF